MALADLPLRSGFAGPDSLLLFTLSVATIAAVTVFGAIVIGLLLHRRYRRNLEHQKMVVMGTTTARILHQIKNPVQSLLLQAELMEDFDREGAEELRREAGRAIVGESVRLAAMLNELSAWTSGAQRQISRMPIALHELVTDIGQQEQLLAAQRGVEIEVRIDAEATVDADSYYLRQALDNLVRNAVEALQQRPGARVQLVLGRASGQAVVRVIDNGPGIPPSKRTRVFEPFITTKGSGMGLGLPISKEIVERHGGQLRLESTSDEGTTFSVTLPLHLGSRSGRAARAGGDR